MEQIIKNEENSEIKIEAIIRQNYKLLEEFLGFRFARQEFIGRLKLVSKGYQEVIIESGRNNIMSITEYIELTAGTYPNPAIEIKVDYKNKTAEAISIAVIERFASIDWETEKREPFNIYLNAWLTDLKKQEQVYMTQGVITELTNIFPYQQS